MPNRIIREGILHSPRMAKLGWAEEVFYRRLHSVVDDFGRYYADPGLLHAACYPRQLNKVSDPDIGKWLRACVDAALVRVYPAQDGESYLEVLDFGQQVRAKKSRFPNPPSTCAANAQQMPSDAHLDVSVSVSVSEDVKPAAQAFVLPEWIPEDTWAAYCKVRTGKKAKNEPHALGLIVKDLEAFKVAGHDPVAVLNNSIKSGWAGVFEPKGKPPVGQSAAVPVQVFKPAPDLTPDQLAANSARAAKAREMLNGITRKMTA
jgi:hypothetical protein